MVDAPQTLISVKKTDGTVVKMTLAEFKIYRESIKALKLESLKAEDIITDELAVISSSHQELSTTTPVTDLFVNEAKAKVWASEDHTSLLEEELHDEDIKVKAVAPSAVPSRDSALLMVILGALPFQISDDVRGRVQSLIESRIKDVRSDDDIILYGTKAIADGGLGLSDEQAETLLKTILDTLNLSPSTAAETEALSAESASTEAEEAAEAEEPAVRSKAASPFSYHQPSRDELPWQPRPVHATSAVSAIPSTSDGRPLVHDINPPQDMPRSMGPVDEFRFFSLTDLHRLGTKADQVTATMVEKFMFLKNESFILYLDAVDAFRQSPVYKKYLSVLVISQYY
jgi:hypothetical protein